MLPYLVAAAVALPAFVILGDLLYSLIAKARYRRWEAGIGRDADGVRLGCREFTLGDGEDAVLLVHGFGDSPSVFQRMAPALAAQRVHLPRPAPARARPDDGPLPDDQRRAVVRIRPIRLEGVTRPS